MKIFKLSLLALFIVVFAACEETDRTFPEFGDDDVQTGAYARKIDGVNGIFDFFDPAGSNIDFTVEFYDVNEGRDVANYSWTATHINNAGGDNTGPVPVMSIDASSFGTSDFGLPSTTINFSLGQTLTDLGLTAADINGGDNIRYEATITMNDGRTFDRFNTGSNVISGASFAGTFILDQPIICPSDLGGTYDVSTTAGLPWPYPCPGAGAPWTGTTTWTESAEGVYDVEDFSFGGYYSCSGTETNTLPGGTLQVQDACNILAPIGASRWGEVYTFTSVTVSGSDLTIVWENDYGENGTSVISRTDGTDWPPLTN